MVDRQTSTWMIVGKCDKCLFNRMTHRHGTGRAQMGNPYLLCLDMKYEYEFSRKTTRKEIPGSTNRRCKYLQL